jgi:hypothetical protein
MVADVMSATLSALNLFSQAGVLFARIEDVNMVWKSALCFEIAFASSAVAAVIAASVTVNFVTLGKGGLDAMLAKVSSIVSTAGLFLTLSNLELRISRIDLDGFEEDFDRFAAGAVRPGLGWDLGADWEQDLEQGRAALSALLANWLSFVSLSLLVMVLKISV